MWADEDGSTDEAMTYSVARRLQSVQGQQKKTYPAPPDDSAEKERRIRIYAARAERGEPIFG